MKVTFFELEPTATWLQRKCLWIPGGLGDGFLTITLVAEKRHHWEQDVYGVEEVMPLLFGTRRFMLIRGTDQPGDAAQEQPYVVTVGKFTTCTCEAGRKAFRTTTCKHLDAIAHMVEHRTLQPRIIEGNF